MQHLKMELEIGILTRNLKLIKPVNNGFRLDRVYNVVESRAESDVSKSPIKFGRVKFRKFFD